MINSVLNNTTQFTPISLKNMDGVKLMNRSDTKFTFSSQKLPILDNDTQDIIEYVKNTQSKKKKKYYFWELLNKNE